MIKDHLKTLILIVCHLTSQQIFAEGNDVEILTTDKVGRYSPDHTPDLEVVRKLIVEQTNQFRRKQGRSNLEQSKKLNRTAQHFANYMAETDRYGHTADNQEPHERTKKAGYQHCQIAENIGYFFRTVGYTSQELSEEAVQGWINSPGHRENMLLEHITQIGVGIAQSPKTHVYYAVQLFGRPRSLMINFSIENRSPQAIEYLLGEKTFSLEPKYTRTHSLCERRNLQFSKDGLQKTYQPQEGENYKIETINDDLSISITDSDSL